MKHDYQDVIVNAESLLKKNTEWIGRFDGYADAILANEDFIKSSRQLFHSFSPLRFYISITQAKGSKATLTLDVRYMGQNVAILKAKKNGEVTTSTKEFDATNSRDFGCNIKLDKAEWTGADARGFRSYFKALPLRASDGKGNEEHNVESMLITEFSKAKGKEKVLVGIQPVRIAGVRFGMPTPVSASNHKKLKYSYQYGGGIDILARSGKPPHSYLTVIEVKDENVKDEPPQDALKQSIEYAVFLRELLRSKSGSKWWHLFGYSRKLPKGLIIRCACAMPDDNPDKEFAGKKYFIGEDVIECHYIYFKIKNGFLDKIDSSIDSSVGNE